MRNVNKLRARISHWRFIESRYQKLTYLLNPRYRAILHVEFHGKKGGPTTTTTRVTTPCNRRLALACISSSREYLFAKCIYRVLRGAGWQPRVHGYAINERKSERDTARGRVEEITQSERRVREGRGQGGERGQ